MDREERGSELESPDSSSKVSMEGTVCEDKEAELLLSQLNWMAANLYVPNGPKGSSLQFCVALHKDEIALYK